MKKLLVAAMVGVLAMSALSTAQARGGKQQSVEGTIALPAPFTDDTGCFAGVHRRVQAVAQGAANGVFGYNFAVDKATWNKNFVLEVTGGQGDVDMDITFYLGPLTTLQDIIDAGGDAAPPASISFATRAPGGEAGKVPALAENVIICIYGGGQGAGAAGSFSYTAGAGVKPPKG